MTCTESERILPASELSCLLLQACCEVHRARQTMLDLISTCSVLGIGHGPKFCETLDKLTLMPATCLDLSSHRRGKYISNCWDSCCLNLLSAVCSILQCFTCFTCNILNLGLCRYLSFCRFGTAMQYSGCKAFPTLQDIC